LCQKAGLVKSWMSRRPWANRARGDRWHEARSQREQAQVDELQKIE
jgi:hypothetical protein